MRELNERRADFIGDQAHEQAVNEQKQYEEEQDRQEEEYRKKREDLKSSAAGLG